MTLDELRERMPRLQTQATIRNQLDALTPNLSTTETYLKPAENLDRFLGRLRDGIDSASIKDRQRVLRAVVREIATTANSS